MSRHLTKEDLEQIRAAAINYYRKSKHEFKRTFVAELKRGMLLLDGERSQIGIWHFRINDGRMELVRLGPHHSDALDIFNFGVVLARKKEWSIKEDFYERIMALRS